MAQSPRIEIATPHAAKIHAKKQLAHWGWATNKQWACLNELWTNESNWRPQAFNKTPVTQVRDGKRVKLHAGGIPQILGLDPATPVATQITKGFTYIESRYETPCRALAFWNQNSWY